MDKEFLSEFANWFEGNGFEWLSGQEVFGIGAPDGWRVVMPKDITMKQAYTAMVRFFSLYESAGQSHMSFAFEKEQASAFPWLADAADTVGIDAGPFPLRRPLYWFN